MKFALSAAIFAVLVGSARADVVRLLDGTELVGRYVGGSETEIWFQQTTPLTRPATRVIPTSQVESVTFGPVSVRQSPPSANHHPMEQPPGVLPANGLLPKSRGSR